MTVRNECAKHQRKEELQQCCANDGGRSAETAMQVEVSNHLKMLQTKAVVLSVKEKAVIAVR